jgi:hypothetical protein
METNKLVATMHASSIFRRKYEPSRQTMLRRAAKKIEALLLHVGANAMPAPVRMSQVVARAINPPPRIGPLGFPGKSEQRDESANSTQAGLIEISNRSAFEKKPAAAVERSPRRDPQRGSFGVVAATSQRHSAVKFSFMYLTKQYFSGCRMWQSGDSEGEFPHIFQVRSRLA